MVKGAGCTEPPTGVLPCARWKETAFWGACRRSGGTRVLCGFLCTICMAAVGALSILKECWLGGMGRAAPQEEEPAALAPGLMRAGFSL